MTNIDENREFIPVHIAVMTVSDSRDMATDKSGDILSDRVREAGHHLADRVIVRDEKSDIIAQLERWIADPKIDVVISTGG
ncbi:MAG TPA: molybdenum cofactor biosynthesis protein, partial [Alphaproteobacteria bacterium]|nr:molybdenum cofactor biosynthesis protein [Alphaproteobacteria bacterium]